MHIGEGPRRGGGGLGGIEQRRNDRKIIYLINVVDYNSAVAHRPGHLAAQRETRTPTAPNPLPPRDPGASPKRRTGPQEEESQNRPAPGQTRNDRKTPSARK
ncbi:uncharacterized protein LOC143902911 isoform X1 [Temnothorax americanus]|uniref:uncharacterized protein LOC143902911 isoform X1 n=1 Tax=Temnothorax americanus TaxID=1964332 RepID=UPI0040679FBE